MHSFRGHPFKLCIIDSALDINTFLPSPMLVKLRPSTSTLMPDLYMLKQHDMQLMLLH